MQREPAAQVARELRLVEAALVGVIGGDERREIGDIARLGSRFSVSDQRAHLVLGGLLRRATEQRDGGDAEKFSTRSQFHRLTYCMEGRCTSTSAPHRNTATR